MKKTICYLLICVLLLSSLVCFIGCDESTPETKTNQTQSAQTKVQTTKAVTTTKKECSHDWKAATCSAPKTCSLCGKSEGTPLEHTWSEATCTSPKTCTICNATEGTATEHSWKNATCTSPKTCTVCHTTSGSAAGHSWKNATCTSPKTCTVCHTTSGSATGHSWKNATCTSPKTCTVCHTTSGSALGHSYTNYSCSRCRKTALCTKNYSGTNVPDFGSMFSQYLSPTLSTDISYFYSTTAMDFTNDDEDVIYRYDKSLSNNGFYLTDAFYDNNGDNVLKYYNSRYDCVYLTVCSSGSLFGILITIM